MDQIIPRVSVVHPEGGPLMTKQSMALDSDVNQIVARHIQFGAPLFEDSRATYGDFTGIGDYHSALNAVKRAQDEFEALPAALREHCKNDPGEFLQMVYDPERRGELEKLGLVEAAAPEAAPPAAPKVVEGAPVGGAPGPVAPVAGAAQ